MQRKLLTLVAMTVLAAFLAAAAVAVAEEPAREYVGLKKCKMCHKKKDKGNQYGQWLETAHAKAFETLGGEKAIAKGTKDRESVGLTKPDESVCLRCHNEDNPFYTEFDFDTAFEKIAHPRPEGVEIEDEEEEEEEDE